MVYAQNRIRSSEWDAQTVLGFRDTNISPMSPRRSFSLQKKTEKLSNRELCRPSGPQSENLRKRKEREILGPCLRTKKKLWKKKVTVMPVIIGALGTIRTGLVRKLKELRIAKRIRTTALLMSVRILRKVLGSREKWYHTDLSERPSANAGMKNLKIIIIIIIIINWISPNGSTKQRHKNQSYQSENR